MRTSSRRSASVVAVRTVRTVASALRVAGYLRDTDRHLLHRRATFRYVSRNVLGRGILLLDGGRDRDGNLRHLIQRVADFLDRDDRCLGGAAQTGDVLRDFVGGLGCLCRKRLHLTGHDGKPLACLAGPRGLDGRVQRQQVGLSGNAGNQPDHRTDAFRRLGQRTYRALRLGALCRRPARNVLACSTCADTSWIAAARFIA